MRTLIIEGDRRYELPKGMSPDEFMRKHKLGDYAEAEPEQAEAEEAEQVEEGEHAPALKSEDEARAHFESMHHTKLAELVEEAGGEPASGEGSKAANIEWLVENVDLDA